MKIAIVLGLFALCLQGCVAMSTELKHPMTGDRQRCSAAGGGWLGAPAAIIMHESCVVELKKKGYVE